MLVAAAVCPHPPPLHPALAGGLGGDLEPVRAACDEAVRALIAAAPDAIVAVGAAREHEPLATGLGPYGLDVELTDEKLPLSLLIASYLLDRSGWNGLRVFESVAEHADTRECIARGNAIVQEPRRVCLLVMGDGSARRTEKAPGWIDRAAEPFDHAIARALAGADTDALGALDPHTCDALMVGGRAAWQVLVGAARGSPMDGRLILHDAPHGVGYFVALWTPRAGANS